MIDTTINTEQLAAKIRTKMNSVDHERYSQEQAHYANNDPYSSPSTRLARLEGEVSSLRWVLNLLERQ